MAAASSSARWVGSRRDSGIAQRHANAPTTASPSRTGNGAVGGARGACDDRLSQIRGSLRRRRQVVVAQAGQRDRAVRRSRPPRALRCSCRRPCSNWHTPGNAARGSSCAWHTRRTATRSSSMGAFSPSEGAGHADTRACPATRARALVPRATRDTSSSICGRSAAPAEASARTSRARARTRRATSRRVSVRSRRTSGSGKREVDGAPALRPAPAPGRRQPATVAATTPTRPATPAT